MNVSLRETGCLKKSLDGIFFFILPPCNAYCVHNRSSALFTAETKETMLIDVQAPPAGREWICINSAYAVLFPTDGFM